MLQTFAYGLHFIKIRNAGGNLIFLQMGVVDCFVESCGFKYKHISNSQCYKVRSNIDFFLFTNGLLY